MDWRDFGGKDQSKTQTQTHSVNGPLKSLRDLSKNGPNWNFNIVVNGVVRDSGGKDQS